MNRKQSVDSAGVAVALALLLAASAAAPGVVLAQVHPVLSAPIRPVGTDRMDPPIRVELSAEGQRASARQEIFPQRPADTLKIFTRGYVVNQIQLVAGGTTWSPQEFSITDSVVTVYSPADTSLGTPDTLRFDWSGSGGFIRTVDTSSGQYTYSYNYPFIDRNIFPSLQESAAGPIVLDFSMAPEYAVSAPGALSATADTSRGIIRFSSTTPVSLPGRYWIHGPFDVLIDRVYTPKGSEVALRYLHGGDAGAALQSFGSAPEAIRFLSDALDRAPRDLSVNIISVPGLKDNRYTNLIGLFGEPAAVADEVSDVLQTASSIAFDYFGRYGESSAADSWLFTGIPLYFGALFVAEDQDEPTFDSLMLDFSDNYFDEAARYERPLFHPRWNDALDLVDAHAWSKGAWAAHTLRSIMGDELFYAALSELSSSVILTTDNLTQILESYLDPDQQALQRHLFYEPGHLELKATWDYDAASTVIRIQIEHIDSGEQWPDVPLDLEIETLTGFDRRQVILKADGGTFNFQIDGRPRYVTVDPDQTYLARIDMSQSVAAWVAQLRSAASPGVRVRAARALRDFSDDPALLIGLKSALRNESRVIVRKSIIETIGSIPPGAAARQALVDALDETQVEVAAAALRALSAYPDDAVVHNAVTRVLQSAGDERVLAEAVAYISLSSHPDRDRIIESALVTSTKNGMVIEAGLQGLAVVKDTDSAQDMTRKFMSSRYTDNIRNAAITTYAALVDGRARRAFLRENLAKGDVVARLAAASIAAETLDAPAKLLSDALKSESNPIVRKRLRELIFAVSSE